LQNSFFFAHFSMFYVKLESLYYNVWIKLNPLYVHQYSIANHNIVKWLNLCLRIFFRLFHDHSRRITIVLHGRSGVNFNNVLCSPFSHESLWAAFFYLLFGFEYLAPKFCTKNARVKFWWNWLQSTVNVPDLAECYRECGKDITCRTFAFG